MATSRGLRTTSAVWLPHTLSARAVLVLGAALDERLLLVLFGGLVLLAIVVIQLAELALPLSSDQALYSFIGRAIHQGAVPYRDLVDLKPPGIFYLRAALDVLAPVSWTSACVPSPLPASCGWMVLKLADLLTTLLFGAGVFAAARTMQFDRGAAFVSAALGALYVSLSYLSQLGLSPEKLAAGCALLAVLMAARSHWLLAGMAAALGVLMKQPSGTVLAPVALLALVASNRRWRRVGRVMLGFALPLVLIATVLAVQGALGAALEYTVAINLERIRTPAALGGFGGDNALQIAWQAFRNGLAPFWVLGGAGLLAAARLPGQWRLVLVGWLLVDVVLLVRLRELMQLGPSLALLDGWAVGCVWQAAAQPPYLGFGRRSLARLALIGGMLSLVLLSLGYQESIVMRALNERTLHGLVRSPDEFVVDALAHLPPGPLFVWGSGTELYVLSQRHPASSTLNAIPLSANLPGAAARRARLLAELDAVPPAAIALSPEAERAGNGLDLDGFPALAQLLATAYAPVAEVASDPKYGGWRLYVRRGAG
jgi:hypothetical protein